jgi:hypothetical protein
VAVSYEQAGNIMLAGLALQVSCSTSRIAFARPDGQIFAWVVFILFLLIAMVRAYRFPSLQSKRYDPMRWMLWATLFSALMLIWRACFRCAEAATGESPCSILSTSANEIGYLNGPATNEPMFACFEYLPVILAVGLWSIVPPSRFIEDKLPGSVARAEEMKEEPKLAAVSSDETEAARRV